jgi:hypothetical protein
MTVSTAIDSAPQTQFTWQVCELGVFFCSNDVSVDFGPNPADDQATVITERNGQKIVETIRIEEEGKD